jgi:hypothetical protein
VRTIAALFVEHGGPYFGLPGVDPWDEARDARRYTGPYPIVAHPPCERWGRYWSGGPNASYRRELGADDGCFESAYNLVRYWGGVIEHPEGSHAWRAAGWNLPPKRGGWVPAGDGGFTCCVEQGHYGHRARKATWLYAIYTELPDLTWGKAYGKARLDDGCNSKEDRIRRKAEGRLLCAGDRLSRQDRIHTPEPFRDLLISIARTVLE